MNGSLAIYENPRAARVKVTGTDLTLTVLGIWTDGRSIKYLIVGDGKKHGARPRFVRGADVDIHVGQGG